MDHDVEVALKNNLTVSVEVAAKAFEVGKNAAYRAIASGDIPSVRVGGKIRVPTALVRKMLGIEAA